MTRPEIEIAAGKLPRFWDRSVLFFCNLHSIFYDNREEVDELIGQIYGAHSYGSRVVSILNLLFREGPNRIFLEAAPEANLLHYLSDDLRLSLPGFDVLDERGYRELAASLRSKGGIQSDSLAASLKNHPAQWVDGFVTDATLVEVADRLQKRTVTTAVGSKNGNNKYLLYRHQLEKGLPVFDTFLAASAEEIPSALARLHRLRYRKAVVKAQIGASGYGMVKLDTRSGGAPAVPRYFFFEGPCMVQGWLDGESAGVTRIGSPSVQMFLNDATVFLFDWTEQILSEDSVHEGNMSPPPYAQQYPALGEEIFRQAAIAGEWLHDQGYRGTASADFLVINREKNTEVVICEINARVTGATYPAVLARHFLPEAYWNMRNIRFRGSLDGAEILSMMRRAGVLYGPGKSRGILPFNFNIDAHGKVIKGQFLCLGEDHEGCNELLGRAWRELPVQWGYDRD